MSYLFTFKKYDGSTFKYHTWENKVTEYPADWELIETPMDPHPRKDWTDDLKSLTFVDWSILIFMIGGIITSTISLLQMYGLI